MADKTFTAEEVDKLFRDFIKKSNEAIGNMTKDTAERLGKMESDLDAYKQRVYDLEVEVDAHNGRLTEIEDN